MSEPTFTILIAEDNPDDARLLRRALQRNHIYNPVQLVSDGQEAIDYLEGIGKYSDRETYPRPQFLILDLKMPRKSGLDVLEWLRNHPRFRIIPTLILTSSSHQKDVVESYRLGANSFLVKPGRFEDLERMVKTIHEYWAMAEKLNWAEITEKTS